MTDERMYDLLSALLVFVVAVIFVYLSIRLESNLRKLSISFAVFVVMHGIYHVVRFFGFEFVADGVLEPISIVILIIFGLLFFKIKRQKLEART